MIALLYIRAHWRGFGCLLIVLLAFAAGRTTCAQSARTETVERVVTRTVQVEKRVEVQVKQAAQVQRVIVYRDRTVTPDGTTHEREIEASEAAHVERELLAEAQTTQHTQSIEHAVARIVDPRRDWHAGGLIGVRSLRDRSVVFGLHVERRLLGPVSIGAWGLSSGTAGGSLSVDF